MCIQIRHINYYLFMHSFEKNIYLTFVTYRLDSVKVIKKEDNIVSKPKVLEINIG